MLPINEAFRQTKLGTVIIINSILSHPEKWPFPVKVTYKNPQQYVGKNYPMKVNLLTGSEISPLFFYFPIGIFFFTQVFRSKWKILPTYLLI